MAGSACTVPACPKWRLTIAPGWTAASVRCGHRVGARDRRSRTGRRRSRARCGTRRRAATLSTWSPGETVPSSVPDGRNAAPGPPVRRDEHVATANDLVELRVAGELQERRVRVGVVGELVAAVGDALRHVGVGLEPVADDERGHLHAGAAASSSRSWSARPRSPLVWKVSATRDFVVGPDTTKPRCGGGVLGAVSGTAVGTGEDGWRCGRGHARRRRRHSVASAPRRRGRAQAGRRRRGSVGERAAHHGRLTVAGGLSKVRQPLLPPEARRAGARPRSPGRLDAPVRSLAGATGVDHRRPGRAPGAVRARGVGDPDPAAPALGSPPDRRGSGAGRRTRAIPPPAFRLPRRRRPDPRHLAYGPEEATALLTAPGDAALAATSRCCCSSGRPRGSTRDDCDALLVAARRRADEGCAVVLTADAPDHVAAHATTLAVFVAGRLLSWGAPPVALVPALHILGAGGMFPSELSTAPVRPAPSSRRRRSSTSSPRRVRTTGSTGGCSAWKCAVACLLGDWSQHPTCPHCRHRRRCTHLPPMRRQSSQPVLLGVTSRMVWRWEQGGSMTFDEPFLVGGCSDGAASVTAGRGPSHHPRARSSRSAATSACASRGRPQLVDRLHRAPAAEALAQRATTRPA